MVPSRHWILLLWGLQGLWAQDYEDDHEEEVGTSKKKSKLFSSNLVPQNGKIKGSEPSFSFISCVFTQSAEKLCAEHDSIAGGSIPLSNPSPM